MRPRLIAASLYIGGFESLREAIVGRVRELFWRGFDGSGDTIDPKYQSNVLARNRSPVYASLLWLQENKAIDDADLRSFERVKTCRNTLAHDLLSKLGSEGLPSDFDQCFTEMVELLRKIEVWWIINMEVPTNPDYDGRDVDEADIMPGRVMMLRVLVDIVLGDEEKSSYYYDEIRKRVADG